MKKGVDYVGVAVGALIFNDNGELFLSKRSQKTTNERGCWEVPGGSIEHGETLVAAVKREMMEEYGVDIEIITQFPAADHIIAPEKQHWVPTTFLARIKVGQEPKIMEPDKCDGIGWFHLDHLPKPLSLITQIDIEYYRSHCLPVYFYETEYYFFSNFSAHAVEYNGVLYPTAEHAYQGAKFEDESIREEIRQAKSPLEAKHIANKKYKKQRRKDWQTVKTDIMYQVLKGKLNQHTEVKEGLIRTGSAPIIENSPIDAFWGWGANKTGQNEMGKIWMKLRDELK